jgi:hypothetical protein
MTKPIRHNRADTAYHEASHAVAARVQNIKCDCVAINLDKIIEHQEIRIDNKLFVFAGAAVINSTAKLAHDSGADQATQLTAIRKDLIVGLAGPYGEQKHRPLKDRRTLKKRFDGWKNDLEIARLYAYLAALVATGVALPSEGDTIRINTDLLPYADDFFQQCNDAVADLVDKYWPAIERVAQALMTCDLLDQAELDRLIANGT